VPPRHHVYAPAAARFPYHYTSLRPIPQDREPDTIGRSAGFRFCLDGGECGVMGRIGSIGSSDSSVVRSGNSENLPIAKRTAAIRRNLQGWGPGSLIAILWTQVDISQYAPVRPRADRCVEPLLFDHPPATTMRWPSGEQCDELPLVPPMTLRVETLNRSDKSAGTMPVISLRILEGVAKGPSPGGMGSGFLDTGCCLTPRLRSNHRPSEPRGARC
jgi:hypothetical protein